jgi:hypothetical protein
MGVLTGRVAGFVCPTGSDLRKKREIRHLERAGSNSLGKDFTNNKFKK